MRSLKLFGHILLVADSQKPSSLTRGNFKQLPPDLREYNPVKPMLLNVTSFNPSTRNEVNLLSLMSHGSHGPFHHMHFQNENSNDRVLGSPIPVTWPNYDALPSPYVSLDRQESIAEGRLDSKADGSHEREVEEGSLTGSNDGSVNGGEEADQCLDINTQSCQFYAGNVGKEPASVFKLKPSPNSAFCELKASRGECKKGFVPYKRCTSERYTHSSTITREEREEKRVRLCL